MVEGGVAAEADAGPGEYEQHGGDGDEPDVPRQGGEGVVGELGDDAQAGVNGKAEGGGEEPEFDLDDVGDGVVVEPVAGSAEEVVGEPHAFEVQPSAEHPALPPVSEARPSRMLFVDHDQPQLAALPGQTPGVGRLSSIAALESARSGSGQFMASRSVDVLQELAGAVPAVELSRSTHQWRLYSSRAWRCYRPRLSARACHRC